MKVQYAKSALKFLAKLDKRSISRIRAAIDGLTRIPPEGDIKTLKGYEAGFMRLRVGSWRVIYRVEDDTLYIVAIGNRGDIYK